MQSMLDKVKLPKEVAEAIVRVRSNYKSGCEFDLRLLKMENWDWLIPIFEYVEESKTNMINYFNALVIGYEVEQTPEDKVREWYFDLQKQINDGVNGPYLDRVKYEMNTIYRCVSLLGIKISGVNANETTT